MTTPHLAVREVAFPVRSLGPGRRLVVWTQGCRVHCAGCNAVGSWAFAPETAVPVDALVARLSPLLAQADGVTISGGEPFDQPVALQALLRLLQARFAGDVLAYSGYPIERHRAQWPWHAHLLDALMSDPFDATAGQSRRWRGSDNQVLHLFTGRAHQRFGSDDGDTAPRELDLFEGDTSILTAGIHRRDHGRRLREGLQRRGYELPRRQP